MVQVGGQDQAAVVGGGDRLCCVDVDHDVHIGRQQAELRRRVEELNFVGALLNPDPYEGTRPSAPAPPEP